MYKTLTKYGQLFAFGLGLLGILVFLIPVFSGLSEWNTLSEEAQKQSGIFDAGMYMLVVLLVIALLAAVGFGLYQSVSNPKGSLKALGGLALIGIIFAIGYSSMGADPAWMGDKLREFEVSDTQSKFINGAMISLAGMGAIAVLAFVGSEIRNFFK
ncbi:MAG: hypothetical protein AAFO94_16850 [Bacteroidota bacterium]